MLMVIRSVYRYWANLMGATTDSHGKTRICICRRLGVDDHKKCLPLLGQLDGCNYR